MIDLAAVDQFCGLIQSEITFLCEILSGDIKESFYYSEGVERPYPAYPGFYREEAIMLLRRFYLQENEKGESILIRFFWFQFESCF